MKNPIVYIILSAILFTTLEPVSKLIAQDFTPAALTCFRFLMGGLVLLPFSLYRIKKENIRLKALDYVKLALLGIMLVCVTMVVLQQAILLSTSPATIAIAFSSNSVFTILLAAVILKESITKYKVAALILCIAGTVISAEWSTEAGGWPVLMAVLAALAFSVYTVLCKKVMGSISGTISTCFAFLFGGAALLVAILAIGQPIAGNINIKALPALLYLGVAITGIGFWSYFRAMMLSSAMTASVVFFIKPILTPFAVFFINGIVPDVHVFLALAFVVCGTWFAVKTPVSGTGIKLFQ